MDRRVHRPRFGGGAKCNSLKGEWIHNFCGARVRTNAAVGSRVCSVVSWGRCAVEIAIERVTMNLKSMILSSARESGTSGPVGTCRSCAYIRVTVSSGVNPAEKGSTQVRQCKRCSPVTIAILCPDDGEEQCKGRPADVTPVAKEVPRWCW